MHTIYIIYNIIFQLYTGKKRSPVDVWTIIVVIRIITAFDITQNINVYKGLKYEYIINSVLINHQVLVLRYFFGYY